MKHIVKIDEMFCIFKTYELGDRELARIIKKTPDLKEAMKICAEDEGGGVPCNNIGGGNIAGFSPLMKPMFRRKKKKKNG